MAIDLLTHLRRRNESTNVCELFLSLYQSVAEAGLSEVVRRVCWHAPSQYDAWHQHEHPLAKSISDAIGENPNSWSEQFSVARERLLTTLEQAHRAMASSANASEQEVLCVVIALRQLDAILEKILCFPPPGQLSYPSPPRSNGYTIVRKPRTSFYSLYRAKEELREPPPLQHGEFEESLGLISTYVVPELTGGQYFEWSVQRIPESIESVWRGHGQKEISFVLLSFPHGPVELTLDVRDHGFTVRNLGPNESHIQDRVSEQVAKGLEEGVSVLLFPELTSSDALCARVKSLLMTQPNQIGMVVPGSRHHETSPNVWRNRCIAIDPMGRDTSVIHDKFTRYALPEETARRLTQADPAEEILEGIEVTPRRINLYDSHTLGRFAILICRDIIEPQTAEFLRRHYLDHVFVISMSPSLNDFQKSCSQLGRLLDCGIYVVNTGFGDNPHPAFLYLPVRRKQAISACPKEAHEVCDHAFRVQLPRRDV